MKFGNFQGSSTDLGLYKERPDAAGIICRFDSASVTFEFSSYIREGGPSHHPHPFKQFNDNLSLKILFIFISDFNYIFFKF